MDESHRPVKLRKVVLGFPCNSNQTEFKFDLSLNYKMANIIQTYSDQKPTLVVGVGRRLNNMLFICLCVCFPFLIFMSFNRVVKVLNLLFCSFALRGKEPSSQLQFWPRMLGLSWAQSTSKGVFYASLYMHVVMQALGHHKPLLLFHFLEGLSLFYMQSV